MLPNTLPDSIKVYPPPLSRMQLWAVQAAARELAALAQCPDHNVSKPGSPYSVTLIKLASICKGAGHGYIDPAVVLERIQANSEHLHVPPRESLRMWRRAMKTAHPRFPEGLR